VKVLGAQLALGEAEMNSPRKEIHRAADQGRSDIEILEQIRESRRENMELKLKNFHKLPNYLH
jgi:hypothetical protein